jgi:superfamily II DNA or RNA helicase
LIVFLIITMDVVHHHHFQSVATSEAELRALEIVAMPVVKILVFPQNGMRPCWYGVKTMHELEQILQETYVSNEASWAPVGGSAHVRPFIGRVGQNTRSPWSPWYIDPSYRIRHMNQYTWNELLLWPPKRVALDFAVWLVKTPAEMPLITPIDVFPLTFDIKDERMYRWSSEVVYWGSLASVYKQNDYMSAVDACVKHVFGYVDTSSLSPIRVRTLQADKVTLQADNPNVADVHPSALEYSKDAFEDYARKTSWLERQVLGAITFLRHNASRVQRHMTPDTSLRIQGVMDGDQWHLTYCPLEDQPWWGYQLLDGSLSDWLDVAAVVLKRMDAVDTIVYWDTLLREHLGNTYTSHEQRIRTAVKQAAESSEMVEVTVEPDLVGITLRDDQRRVVASMINRETKPFQDTLFVDMMESEDGDVVLSRSPFFTYDRIALKRKAHAEAKSPAGGFVVAPMGFGKTIVACALVSCATRGTPTLIVCPSAVVAQWKSMCASMTTLTAYTHVGPRRRKVSIEHHVKEDIVFTSYDIVKRRDPWIFSVQWGRVIFDESHAITTDIIEESCVAIQAPIRWCMTASISDTRSLERQIRVLFRIPERSVQSHVRQWFLAVRMFAVVGGEPWEPASNMTKKYSVTHERVDVAMPADVETVYREASDNAVAKGWALGDKCIARVLRKISAGCLMSPTIRWKGNSSSGGVKRSSTIFIDDECSICMSDVTEAVSTPCGHTFCRVCLMTALQVKPKCPLCRQKTSWKDAVELSVAQLLVADANQPSSSSSSQRWNFYRASSVCDVVREAPETDTFLIFSQYDDLLAHVLRLLTDHGIQCVTMGSHMPIARRQECLDQFATRHAGCRVMCLNVRWANAGLNLTSANRLVFMESVPNKTHLDQAIGRVDRPGQTRDVLVTTFV